MEINIDILVDNNTIIDSYYCGEPGLSIHIEADGRRILFDTGYSDLFIKNAQQLGIDLHKITDLVISHGHNDHTWGIPHLIQYFDRGNTNDALNKNLICHPNALIQKLYERKPIGMSISRSTLEFFFKIVETSNVYNITDNIIFMGQIPRELKFEPSQKIGETYDLCGNQIDDYVLDDTALVIKTSQGMIIITGCSHSGICNIIKYAKEITGDDRIVTIIGGFHLGEASDSLLEFTGEYFNKQLIDHIHPCHCTGFNAKLHLAKFVDIRDIGSGLKISYPC
ncbi:MBL fold metallo-hydrolase [Serratia marcescens]|uniref:MBL fold metallo-hydrolase n=1 Tax=Serratia marcescens TaxID=615 RepID=UPI003EDEB47F